MMFDRGITFLTPKPDWKTSKFIKSSLVELKVSYKLPFFELYFDLRSNEP